MIGLGLGLTRQKTGGAVDPYAEFDAYLAVSSAADYETATGVSRWINRTGNTDYDAVQATAASQPTPAADGLDWDNSNDYMRISQIATDLQAYIAASEHPNFAIAMSVTFTDGDGSPPGFLTDHILFACAPLTGNGYLQCQILTSGSVRIECRNALNADTTSDVNLTLDGGFAPGTYEIGLHFHDAVVDTLLNGSLASSNAFTFANLFSANNPFASANCTIGARISNNTTPTGVFSGRYNAFAYKNNPSGVLTL